MSLYRWVLFPLISAILLSISLGVCFMAIGYPLIKFGFLLGFITGAIIGFGLQLFNEYKTRKVLPMAAEGDFEVVQGKIFTMFTGYDETVALCMKFLEQNPEAKIKHNDKLMGKIEAKTKMGWNTNGNIMNFEIRKITEYATEIEVSTKPSFPTTLVDFGEGLEILEKLDNFFQSESEKSQFKALEENRDLSIGGIIDTNAAQFPTSSIPVFDTKDKDK